MFSKGSIFIIVLGLLIINVNAQLFAPKNYPQHYFIWPVEAKVGIAANFGELRPNHYHMGLDCKTDQKENARIFAAADGYIAKVKIEPSGFGRCIYINHPNGLTTLYAHLNDFNPELEKYITNQQYQLKSWSIFIDIPKELFPVKQGDFIAYSGNTGGSQGPHLHFEIRDTRTDKVLNPLLFGFPILDNIPPDILRLAVYDRNKSTYEQSPRFITLKRQNGAYVTVPGTIYINTDKVSFAITAYDRYTGSTNRNGIYQAVLYDNHVPVTGFQLDSISYDETRELNAHIDYKLYDNAGSYAQHLSRLPGYVQGVYKEFAGDGILSLPDDSSHAITIEVSDANGNTSAINFFVKRNNNAVSLPRQAPLRNRFIPTQANIFENNNLRLYIPENYTYDFFDFRYSESVSYKGPVYQLHYGYVPVHGKFPVSIKNITTTHPARMVMHRYWKNKNDYAKASPGKGEYKDWYTSYFKALGNIELLADTLPPVITPVGFKNGMDCSKQTLIIFVITDNTENLENFSAILDGKQWLRFTNDKGRSFIYRFDEHCPSGKHTLTVSVEDCVGNRTEKTYDFIR